MSARHRLALAGLVLLAATGMAAARELGSAPNPRILGFSPDGRYFGIEQDGGDGVHEKGAFAVDVADATTGRSARGFPRGVTRRPLQALRLTDPGRRLGGFALTDISEVKGPVRVMAEPDIIGAHPGTAMKYTVTAAMPVPEDPDLACRERERSEAHTLTITLKPDIPSWDPEAASRTPNAFREQSVALPFILPPKTCFQAARVTDVYRNESGRSIAVVVAIIFDVGFTDSAEYHATVFALGRD